MLLLGSARLSLLALDAPDTPRAIHAFRSASSRGSGWRGAQWDALEETVLAADADGVWRVDVREQRPALLWGSAASGSEAAEAAEAMVTGESHARRRSRAHATPIIDHPRS